MRIIIKKSNKILNIPIKITIIFSLATIFLYRFGAYDYPNRNRIVLYVFLAAANLAMLLGFMYGTQHRVNVTHRYEPFSFSTLFNVLFVSTLIISLPKFLLYTGFTTSGFSAIQAALNSFFSSAQDIYVNRQSLVSAQGIWKYINYLVVLQGPLYWAYTPLAIICWKQLSYGKKIGSYIIWTLYLLQYLCTGTNVGFFDFFLTVLVSTYVRERVFKKKRKQQSSEKGRWQMILLAAGVLFLLMWIFSITMGSRIGDQYLKGVRVAGVYCGINETSLFWKITPDMIKPVVSYLTRYIAQPYVALEMAFEMPFSSTYGFGHSWFVLDNMGGLSSILWDRTYNMKLEEVFGFGHYANWHTMYLWIANDVSFFGVPVILLMLFNIFGKSWKEVVVRKSLRSFLIVMIFVKMIYFISANNQIFQNSDTLIMFWGLLFWKWFFTRYDWILDEEIG